MIYQYDKEDTTREIKVERFAGVDFTTHPTKVDWTRSPDACNMIADENFFPVKRRGYQRTAKFSHAVYGLHSLNGELLCHSGDSLYRLTDSGAQLLYDDMNNAPSQSFCMNEKLWILDGRTYLVYDGTEVKPVRQAAFVPTTTINAPPKGGGTTLEAVNLIGPYRINTFVGDGMSTSFHLDTNRIDADSVTCGQYTIKEVDREAGIVTFHEAPPDGNGLANVVIQFAKTSEYHSGQIDHCRWFGLFGGSNDTRVFLTGNPDFPNQDWQSGLYDPSYFPDNGYTRVGSDSTAIMGYLRQYDTQIILKEDGSDAQQYQRTFYLDENDRPAYPVRQGSEAAGVVAPRSLAVLNDLPVYLSELGVMGIFGTNVSEQRAISNISQRIQARLLQEPDPADAVSCCWRGRYYLVLGEHCYVADGRQGTDGAPEWYYWTNIPATCLLPQDDALYFGTEDGRVCRFCEPGEAEEYRDDGQAISAVWSTPLSPFGDWSRKKTLLEFYPVLMPDGMEGTEIRYRTEKDEQSVRKIALQVFSFDAIDFADFSFRAQPEILSIPVHRRRRGLYLFQGIVKHEGADQPFGLLGMVIRYRTKTKIRQI
ncbi:MAG: hypothetical protein ACI4PQ_03020 [Butyricicoccaceae bacterium]